MHKQRMSEFVTGCVAASAFMPWYFKVGFWPCLLAILLCGSLWHLGGTIKKTYRRVGVPAAILFAVVVAWRPLGWEEIFRISAAFGLMYAAASVGYGMPSTQPPDNGSALGRFWYFKVFKARMTPAEIATRATVGAAFGSAAISLGGPWLVPIVACSAGFALVWLEFDKS